MNLSEIPKILESLKINPDDISNKKDAEILQGGKLRTYFFNDGAPQYKKLTEEQALCWIHDGRDYTKLVPVVPFHKKELQDFRSRYWTYNGKLLQFKLDPSQENADKLSAEFYTLVSTRTNYEALNELIKKTKEGTKANMV
jgi:hypothetical protein